MTSNGIIPVIAPVGVDDEGHTFNVNADTAAGAIAEALQAEKLMLLTDVEGVLDADGKLRPRLTLEDAQKAIDQGSVQGGMIPKLECCIQAVAQGVRSAHVIDGRISHAVLLEIFTDGGVGTLVRAA
jgi:acetylglutamate kinase